MPLNEISEDYSTPSEEAQSESYSLLQIIRIYWKTILLFILFEIGLAFFFPGYGTFTTLGLILLSTPVQIAMLQGPPLAIKRYFRLLFSLKCLKWIGLYSAPYIIASIAFDSLTISGFYGYLVQSSASILVGFAHFMLAPFFISIATGVRQKVLEWKDLLYLVGTATLYEITNTLYVLSDSFPVWRAISVLAIHVTIIFHLYILALCCARHLRAQSEAPSFEFA